MKRSLRPFGVFLFFLSQFPGDLPLKAEHSYDVINEFQNEGRQKISPERFQVIIDLLSDGMSRANQRQDTSEVIQYLYEIGGVYFQYGNDDKAVESYDKALNLIRLTNDDRKGYVLGLLGKALRDMHDYGKALIVLQEALDFNLNKARTNYIVSTSDNLLDIAAVYSDMGLYAQAFNAYKRAMTYFQEEAGGQLEKGLVYHARGKIYKEIGEPVLALQNFQRAEKIFRREESDKNLSDVLIDMGILSRETGDLPKALDLLSEAMAIKTQYKGFTEDVEAAMGDVLMDQGQFEMAKDLFIKQGNLFKLGHYYFTKNKFAKAQTLWETSLADLKHFKNSRKKMAHHIGLGLTYEALGKISEAADHYTKAFDLAEEARLTLPESQRLNFFSARVEGFPVIESYEGLVRASPDDRTAYYFAEASRARQFTESIARRREGAVPSLPKEWAMRESRLSVRLAAVLKQLETARESGNPSMQTTFQVELEELKTKQDKFLSELRQFAPGYATVHYPKPLYPEELPLALNEVLVEYEVSTANTKAFLIRSKGDIRSFVIPLGRAELAALIKNYRSAFEGIQITSDLARYDPALGQKLFEILLKPVLKSIDPSSQIIIVPDETLGTLPFECMVVSSNKSGSQSGKGGATPTGLTFVADLYNVAYAQSGTALAAQRALTSRTPPSRTLMVLADPVFDSSDSRGATSQSTRVSEYELGAKRSFVKQMGVGGLRVGKGDGTRTVESPRDATFVRLDKTSLLADHLSKITFAGKSATVLLGLNAGETNFKKQPLDTFRYVVMATHGILDNAVPFIREPALVLKQVDTGLTEDGFLTMNEVMDLHFNADIVALTACQTGLGKNVGGEGVMGLGRTFQYAGARFVLVSLWNVAEDSTTLLVEQFFKYVSQGKLPREALMFARSDVRREGFEHPFFWAPFILFVS